VEARPRQIVSYETAGGRSPFEDWVAELKDAKVRGIIMNRIDRVENGNFGDCAPVGEGVSELRIDVGPGYRVYYGQDGDRVVLLGGGSKKTQPKDIAQAKECWRDYNA
jgi:putative addiction module killer protein